MPEYLVSLNQSHGQRTAGKRPDKKSYGVLKTPYQRLLEPPDLSASVKEELRRRAAAINPVTLKRQENQAAARLLRIHERKQGEGLPPLSDAHG
jgi:hypothetical protein